MTIPDPGGLPPDCRLIRTRRLAMVPPMSMRRAARLAGMPEATWRQAETGKRARTYEVLARQSLLVGVSPWELDHLGRPDAAAHLRTLMQQRLEKAGGVPAALREAVAAAARADLDEPLAEIVQGLADIEASSHLTAAQKRELREELMSGIVRDIGERRAYVRTVLRVAHSADVG